MDEGFKEHVDTKIGLLKDSLSILKKEKSFYEFLENSPFADKISEISGSYEMGFIIFGKDYSLVDDFSFGHRNKNEYDFMSDSTASKVGVLKFFGDSKFKEHNARYNLVDENLNKSMMDVLYILHVDNKDYSGTPGFSMGPHFSYPKRLEEMKKFYLFKGMNKDLVSKVINRVELIRRGLGADDTVI